MPPICGTVTWLSSTISSELVEVRTRLLARLAGGALMLSRAAALHPIVEQRKAASELRARATGRAVEPPRVALEVGPDR
jgi:hypothetical protein